MPQRQCDRRVGPRHVPGSAHRREAARPVLHLVSSADVWAPLEFRNPFIVNVGETAGRGTAVSLRLPVRELGIVSSEHQPHAAGIARVASARLAPAVSGIATGQAGAVWIQPFRAAKAEELAGQLPRHGLLVPSIRHRLASVSRAGRFSRSRTSACVHRVRQHDGPRSRTRDPHRAHVAGPDAAARTPAHRLGRLEQRRVAGRCVQARVSTARVALSAHARRGSPMAAPARPPRPCAPAARW